MSNSNPPSLATDAAATKPVALPEALFVLELEERLEMVVDPVSDLPFGKCCVSK